MKKIILAFLILNSSLIFSQAENIVINESFNNNSNNWVISSTSDWSSFIKDGSYNLSNNISNKTSYFKPENLFLNNKKDYEIETNIKFNVLENNASGGIIFISDEEISNNSYSLKLGFCVVISKYNNEYFLYLNKTDWSGFNYLQKLDNYDINKINNLKITIDNGNPTFKVLVNNKLVFENNFPLFNFNNIGFYQMGNISMSIHDIRVKTSNLPYNEMVIDQMDLVYNQSKNINNILIGSQYLGELTKYVPKAILFDDYNFDFKKFKEELMIDENCENFNTIKSGDSSINIFYFNYKSNTIKLGVEKENKFSSIKIIFSAPNKAIEFYNLYSKAKRFKIEQDKAYLPANYEKGIILLKEENSVLILNI